MGNNTCLSRGLHSPNTFLFIIKTLLPINSDKFISEIYMLHMFMKDYNITEVTGGLVVRAGISVTRTVLSWSGGHESEL